MSEVQLRAAEVSGEWRLVGDRVAGFALINDFLAYLADRRYSPRTVRAYAFDLLHFARWLVAEGLALEAVGTDAVLRFLGACRTAPVRGRPGGNVYSIRDLRNSGYAPTTINRRLAALSGLFAFRALRDPAAARPMPHGRAARLRSRGERTGLLAHLGKPQPRSALRLREPRRLPRGLDPDEARALLASFQSFRDRAIASLMLLAGLRSAEVLALAVADVDIGRGWVRVHGKGDKERSVPLDPDIVRVVQTYLLAERPETDASALFIVAKGPHRGRPLSAAGLRRVFRYHRTRAAVPAAHPHALRHTFGTTLAEAGVDLAVLAALLGHDHVDSSAAYIHLAPAHLRAAFDAARERQRARA